MVVLTHVAPGFQDQFRDSELVFAVQFGQISRQDRLVLDLRGKALRIYLARTPTGCLSGGRSRSWQQGRQGQRSERMQDVAPRRLFGHGFSSFLPHAFILKGSRWIACGMVRATTSTITELLPGEPRS